MLRATAFTICFEGLTHDPSKPGEGLLRCVTDLLARHAALHSPREMTEITPATDEESDEPLSIEETTRLAAEIVANVEDVIVGHTEVIEHVVTALLARGHVLLADVPGVGKTMLARSIARSVGCSFRRIQFTPDLLPTDITGVNVFNQQTRAFEFQPGPVFANVVLGDEINRAPPKSQSALLEAMEEAQVTVDGTSHPLPNPFIVIATQNAVESSRTYDLPLAEVDRFIKQLRLGYPTPAEETELLARTIGDHPIDALEAVTDEVALRRARTTVGNVTVAEPVRSYATRLAAFTREHAAIGVSPRGTIALMRAAQARAVIDGRAYVRPDDIQQEAPSVCAHRIQLRSGGDQTAKELVSEAIERVPVEHDPE